MRIGILGLLMVLQVSNILFSQCTCSPLPAPTNTQITVTTVSELQTALQSVSSQNGNVTILLENGTYQLTSNLLFISSNMSKLTIRSLSGNRDDVVIRGMGMGNSNVTHIFNVQADSFTVADMTIGWVYNHPIQVHSNSEDADYFLMQNVKVVDGREQLLKVSGGGAKFADYGIVRCCHFEFSAGIAYQNYTGGIDAHRSKDWVVEYNTFKDIKSPNATLAEHAIHFWRESAGTRVQNNHIINCDRGIGFGLGGSATDGHSGGLIHNNFVHTSTDVGIGLETSPNTKVYHNTIITDNYSNSVEYRFSGTSGVHIANNLCSGNISSRDGGTGSLVTNIENQNDFSIFTSPNQFDYHLGASASIAIDQGTLLNETPLDFDCHARSSPDIGADEYATSNCGIAFISNNDPGMTFIVDSTYKGSHVYLEGHLLNTSSIQIIGETGIHVNPEFVIDMGGNLTLISDTCSNY